MGTHRRFGAAVAAWGQSQGGKWLLLMALFAVVAALFHPLFLVLGGVIGAVTFGVAALGGVVLGPVHGALYGLLTALLGIPLWAMEYGFAPTEAISGPVVSVAIGYGGGWVRRMVLRVIEQADALRVANRALKATQLELLQAEKLALFGEIAAGVAHELNQPLAIIGLSSEVAQLDLAAGNTQDLHQRLDRILEQVQRAGQIVTRLKISGRAGPDDEPLTACDLNGLVRDVVAQFEPQFVALGITFSSALQAPLSPLQCRAGLIRQVLTYLLLNARDAVHETATKRVRVTTLGQNGRVEVAIEDTGVGMPEEIRRRIFDPFFTTKEIGQGSGLGLPISHRIVHEHRGSIVVESTPGQGTRVIVRLPAAVPVGTAQPPHAPSSDSDAA